MQDLFYKNGPETYYEGLIGTLPASKDGPLYSFFRTEYKSKNYPFQELTPFSAMVFDSVLLFGKTILSIVYISSSPTPSTLTAVIETGENPVVFQKRTTVVLGVT